MTVVAYVCAEDAPELEASLIAAQKACGVRLVNLTDGGEGMTGHHPSKKTRRLLSRLARGRKHTDESRKKMSASRRGHRYGAGFTGRRHTEKTKKKILRAARQRAGLWTSQNGQSVQNI